MYAATDNILDVTKLEPRQKHPAIFLRFDELNEEETLIIHNDHDPKPLYYQLLGERGNIFTWEYFQEGPDWWKVSITKRSRNADEETLGQIAAKDLRKAQIFKKHGLDFCCGGKKTLREACAEKGLDAEEIRQELKQTNNVPAGRPIPYEDWSLDFLADYIVNTHHSYVKKTLPELTGYAIKVASVHGDGHPELHMIRELVQSINAELSAHLIKEERILFPRIKELVASNGHRSTPYDHAVQTPINLMEMEHELAGRDLEEIRRLSNNFEAPADACGSYKLLYKMLEEFEDDLHIHVHLENNILFPKTLKLEKDHR